jgi:hypothetical protein
MMSASGGLKFLILGAADPWKEHLGIWVRRGPQKNDFGAQGGSETRFGESRGHAVGGRGVMRSVDPIPDLILQNLQQPESSLDARKKRGKNRLC